jgi:hypothetical protein
VHCFAGKVVWHAKSCRNHHLGKHLLDLQWADPKPHRLDDIACPVPDENEGVLIDYW